MGVGQETGRGLYMQVREPGGQRRGFDQRALPTRHCLRSRPCDMRPAARPSLVPWYVCVTWRRKQEARNRITVAAMSAPEQRKGRNKRASE